MTNASLKIINECCTRTKKIVSENQDLLNLRSNTLLEHETLTKEQIDYLVKNGKMPSDDEVANKKIEEMSYDELKALAKLNGIKGYTKMSEDELKDALMK